MPILECFMSVLQCVCQLSHIYTWTYCQCPIFVIKSISNICLVHLSSLWWLGFASRIHPQNLNRCLFSKDLNMTFRGRWTPIRIRTAAFYDSSGTRAVPLCHGDSWPVLHRHAMAMYPCEFANKVPFASCPKMRKGYTPYQVSSSVLSFLRVSFKLFPSK